MPHGVLQRCWGMVRRSLRPVLTQPPPMNLLCQCRTAGFGITGSSGIELLGAVLANGSNTRRDYVVPRGVWSFPSGWQNEVAQRGSSEELHTWCDVLLPECDSNQLWHYLVGLSAESGNSCTVLQDIVQSSLDPFLS